ncbi:hypothetical protein CEP88_04230 [Roseobacter denitrificans]|uniref:Conserved domain protein n=1 Tax=Roseobacter denitrificans (strain ATCC 33942 / OCh 114) TaxID=375451 RepID=Q165D2_ROSDO|nr:dynamin family protein [Roseobacter denitrificans]ABG32411.1 conserved domain protein [Roseobacter denitrificans OCh 114]AVL51880.1 hypothetical protein CEP88_04230 [Roseobacter denitrificans]SFF81447.1 Dynamin family protein [Roseobacter denitrificans OCh 114]
MTDERLADSADFWPPMRGPRLPRFALMGEFSAGKSTLANLMLGVTALPVQVVATQLPPVWIIHGSQPSVIVDLAGNETSCSLEDLAGTSFDEVAFIKLHCEAEILRHCELIDMPGTSDPNMSSRVWERMMSCADGVLWCSPATQAWRQSEAAVWEDVDPQVQANSMLVLTRADMLQNEADKAKVLRRIRSEAAAVFADVRMVSLAQAPDAREDVAPWRDSAAAHVVERFLVLAARVAGALEASAHDPLEVSTMSACSLGADHACTAPPEAASTIVPRRPQARRDAPRNRPTRDASEVSSRAVMP